MKNNVYALIGELSDNNGFATLKCEDSVIPVHVHTINQSTDGLEIILDVVNVMDRCATPTPAKKKKSSFVISRVIFNDPATIVLWEDGTKTVVKVQPGETFDAEKGLAMAISKKIYGNKGNFNEVFKKWVPDEMFEEKPKAPSSTYGSGVVIASGRYPWGSGQAERAIAQLERVSGHSIDDLTKLFAEGLVMCEKSFVDRLIERNAELEARLVKEKI